MLVVEAGQIHAFGYVILAPVGVPPFLRVDLDAFELHAEVNVVISGQPRLTALAQDLPAIRSRMGDRIAAKTDHVRPFLVGTSDSTATAKSSHSHHFTLSPLFISAASASPEEILTGALRKLNRVWLGRTMHARPSGRLS
jgi:hypothetical protein